MSTPEPTTPLGPRVPMVPRRGFLAGAGLAGLAAALAACGEPRPTIAGTAPSAAPTSGPAAPAASSAQPAAPTTGAAPSLPAAPTPIPSRTGDNPVAAENGRPGSHAWDDRRARTVEAYIGRASVAPGAPVELRASGSGMVDVEWYRLGWYGGRGGRLVRIDRGVALSRQATPRPDPATGLVEPGWAPALRTTVPSGVPSGLLVAVLRAPGGPVVANVPLVLRPDPAAGRRAPVLFVSATATWQAYNPWAGLDLYGNTSGAPVAATGSRRAAAVSFARPYARDGGAGYLRRWELQFVRWMEREGRDVEYAADVDLELHPDLVAGRRMIVLAGHAEYWSRPMRETIEAAIASGANVAFLSANEIYWQARLEPGPAGPASRLVCYKSASADPMTAIRPALATCRWREYPVSDPEATVIGQMYGRIVLRPADWIVAEPDHWLYEGTRVVAGDRFRNLVGQEYDTFFPALAPPGTTILARSPVKVATRSTRDPGAFPSAPIHTATSYTAQSGATVLAAGTYQWSWAIDRYGDRSYGGVTTPYDERVARMTRNLFDRLGDGPLAP